MTSPQRREELRTRLENLATEIMDSKGKEYCDNNPSDVLDNIRRVAKELDLPMQRVLGVFAKKHWDSIMAYCKDPSRLMSEPLETRVVDLNNYMLMLMCIHDEEADADVG